MFKKINNRLSLLILVVIIITLVFAIVTLNKHTSDVAISNAKDSINRSFNILQLRIYKRYYKQLNAKINSIINNENIHYFLIKINTLDKKENHKELFLAKEKLSDYISESTSYQDFLSISLYNNKNNLLSYSYTHQGKSVHGHTYKDTNKQNELDNYHIDLSVTPSKYPQNEVYFFFNKNHQLCIERFSSIKIEQDIIGSVKMTACQTNKQLQNLTDFTGNKLYLIKSSNISKLQEQFNIQRDDLKSIEPLSQHFNGNITYINPFISKKYISLIHYIKLLDGKKLYLVVSADKKAIDQDIMYTTYMIFIILLLCFIILYMVVWLFTNKHIIEPIDNIEKGFKSLEDGKYTPVEIKTDNELTKLAEKFNHLILQLETSHKKEEESKNKILTNLAFLKSYELAMNESSIVSTADLKGNITFVNDNFCKVSGYTSQEVLGKPHSIVRHPDSPKDTFRDIWDTISNKKVWKGILKNKGKYNDYWVDITILPILDDDGTILEYIAIRHDITEMINQKNRLDNIANTDLLTGFGSRYKLTQDIRASRQPALAIININNFSALNDFYGTSKGDEILKFLGKSIDKNITDPESKIYHLQGDEYVVFNKNAQKDLFVENILLCLEKIEKEALILDDDEIFLNLSSGISFELETEILKTADIALKTAKKEQVSYILFNDSITLNEEYKNNINWTKKIKSALIEHRVIPVFQPIINNKTNKWEKFESLVRIEDEDGSLISPFHFLEISKKSKQYKNITKVMLDRSFEMFENLNVEFSINLTIEDILDAELQTYIFILLEKHKIGKNVVFEIVESELIEDFDKVSEFIDAVKSYDCKIAIDDFGTGYSNFEYLIKLKADYIKIDGSLIKDIDTNPQSRIVVSTIVSFAQQLNMKTIAEFVENNDIQNTVKYLGIDYSQGYLFSKPEKNIPDSI